VRSRFGLFYVSLFVLFKLLFHLDFREVAFTIVEFGFETYERLGDFT
jgi:hypothetical protein